MESTINETKKLAEGLSAIIIKDVDSEEIDFVESFFRTKIVVGLATASSEIENIKQNIDIVLIQSGAGISEIPNIIGKNIFIKNATTVFLTSSDLTVEDILNYSYAGIEKFCDADLRENLRGLKGFKQILINTVTKKTRWDALLNKPKTELIMGAVEGKKKQLEKRGKFIVVEPVIPSQNILKKAFSLSGIQDSRYKFVDSYEQGVALITQNLLEYSIVVIGGVDGQLEATKAFISTGAELYIQVISGSRDQKQLREIISSGADEIIPKPFELDQLVDKLKKAETPVQVISQVTNKSVYNMKNLVDAYNDFAIEDDLKTIHKDFFKRFFVFLQYR